jgi:Family of unknown function (DUF6615)
MSICDSFRNSAFFTWDIIAQTQAHGVPYGEETITAINIFEIQKRHPTEIFAQSFHRRREGKTGADWEWWMTGRSRKWIGLRLQAKLLDTTTDTFRFLHERVNRTGPYQCEELISNALGTAPKKIPLYCLYINSLAIIPQFLGRNRWPCRSFAPASESFGCSIVSPFIVRLLRPRKNSLSDLVSFIYPWHCLTCCTGYPQHGTDLPSRAYGFWHEAIRQKEADFIRAEDDEGDGNTFGDDYPGYLETPLVDQPPLYVRQIMEHQRIEAPDGNIRAVVVSVER